MFDKVKPERSGERDLSLSTWHRNEAENKNLPATWCYATDVDFVECRYRNKILTIVAIIEAIDCRDHKPITNETWQDKVLVLLATACKVKYYKVKHNLAIPEQLNKIFHVYDFFEKQLTIMEEKEYKNFIESL